MHRLYLNFAIICFLSFMSHSEITKMIAVGDSWLYTAKNTGDQYDSLKKIHLIFYDTITYTIVNIEQKSDSSFVTYSRKLNRRLLDIKDSNSRVDTLTNSLSSLKDTSTYLVWNNIVRIIKGSSPRFLNVQIYNDTAYEEHKQPMIEPTQAEQLEIQYIIMACSGPG